MWKMTEAHGLQPSPSAGLKVWRMRVQQECDEAGSSWHPHTRRRGERGREFLEERVWEHPALGIGRPRQQSQQAGIQHEPAMER